MKNSGFRGFYQDRYAALRDTISKRTGRTYRPAAASSPAIGAPAVEPWRCSWCSKPNPVGAKICESCGMVRTE
jgi:hypothetical protein